MAAQHIDLVFVVPLFYLIKKMLCKTLIYKALYITKSDRAGTRTQDPYIKSVLLYQLSYAINHEKATLFGECKNRSNSIDNNISI
jgi:hypothetical protein